GIRTRCRSRTAPPAPSGSTTRTDARRGGAAQRSCPASYPLLEAVHQVDRGELVGGLDPGLDLAVVAGLQPGLHRQAVADVDLHAQQVAGEGVVAAGLDQQSVAQGCGFGDLPAPVGQAARDGLVVVHAGALVLGEAVTGADL